MTTQKKELLELYRKFRARKPFMLVGHDARISLESARTLIRFRELESLGVVRMRCEPESENYFHVYGEPEPYERNGHMISQKQATKELEEIFERDGVWWTVSEWFDGEEWQHADSCGMHSGYKDPLDPFENCYVIGEMQSAIDAYENYIADQQAESLESQDAACRDIVTV